MLRRFFSTMNTGKLRRNLLKSYSNGAAERFTIQDDSKIDWNVPYPDYSPPSFTIPIIIAGKAVWADPQIQTEKRSFNWNTLDGNVNRVSYMGQYQVDENCFPLNPVGRTGLKGRGRLGRWGPNHACDPIVTRWKKQDGNPSKDSSGLPYLQFIGIQRKDTGDWAIPGGMVDAGEETSSALRREFMEEVFNSDELSESEKSNLSESIFELFEHGVDIYKGYVDDPRNTDNAWIETRAVNFHVVDDAIFTKVTLKAGSDAASVQWIDIDKSVSLYASHKDYIHQVALNHGAHW